MLRNENGFFNELKKNLTQWEKTASSPEVSTTNATETKEVKQAPQTSKVAKILKELVKIAEELDCAGDTKTADVVDKAIKTIASKAKKAGEHLEEEPIGMETFEEEFEPTNIHLQEDPTNPIEEPVSNEDEIDRLLSNPDTRDYLKRKLQGL